MTILIPRQVTTHPRGMRLNDYSVILLLMDFNPRTREGYDRSQFLQCPALRKVLIHAPAGMRHAKPISEITNRKVLIHASMRDATLITHMANQSNTF